MTNEDHDDEGHDHDDEAPYFDEVIVPESAPESLQILTYELHI